MSRGRVRLRKSTLAAEQARLLADAVLKHPGARMIRHRSSETDHARLRGIPIQAPGVGGTQRGTRPDGFIDRMKDPSDDERPSDHTSCTRPPQPATIHRVTVVMARDGAGTTSETPHTATGPAHPPMR